MTATFDSKGGILHLVDGNNHYSVTAKGLFTAVDPGETEVKFEGRKAINALNEAMIHVEDNGSKLSSETKAALSASINHVKGVDPTRLANVRDGLIAAENLEKAKTVTEVENLLKKPLAKELMTDAGTENLSKLGFDLSAYEAAAKKVAEKAAKITSVNKELTKLLKAEKPSKDAVKKFLTDNQAHLADLKPEAADVSKFAAGTKYNVTSAISAIETEVATHVTRAQELAATIIEKTDLITSKPPEATLKLAQKAQEEATKELEGILSHEYAGVIKSRIPEEVAKDLGSVHPTLGAKLGTAENAAKGEGKILKTLLFKSEEALQKVAKSEKVAVSELGFLKKVSKGKAAAIAVVGAAIVAAIGSRGPGKSQEAEMERRNAAGFEPAVSRA